MDFVSAVRHLCELELPAHAPFQPVKKNPQHEYERKPFVASTRTIVEPFSILWQDQQYEIENISITPFGCILQTSNSEIPKELYKADGADVVLGDGTRLPCDVIWSMNDSNAIITIMWNGILSIDDIYGLEVEKTSLDFNSEG